MPKKIRLKKGDVGRWARTQWDDVGARDGVIVDIDDDLKGLTVFEPHNSESTSVSSDQVVSLGDYLGAKNTGL